VIHPVLKPIKPATLIPKPSPPNPRPPTPPPNPSAPTPNASTPPTRHPGRSHLRHRPEPHPEQPVVRPTGARGQKGGECGEVAGEPRHQLQPVCVYMGRQAGGRKRGGVSWRAFAL